MTTTKQTTHTPTPWKIHGEGAIVSKDLNYIAYNTFWRVATVSAQHTPEGQANAQFIVLACNAYAQDQARIRALAEALETLVADMQQGYRDRNGDVDHDGIEKAQAALKLAALE